MKACSGCQKEFELSEFVVDRKSKDGRGYYCKECRSKKAKIYVEKNREKVKNSKKEWELKNKDRISTKGKIYYKKNVNKFSERGRTPKARVTQKKYREKTKNKAASYIKEYRILKADQIRETVRLYQKRRRSSDPSFKLADNLRNRIWKVLKNPHSRAGSHVRDLGCDIKELVKRLESMFYDSHLTGQKMTWDNYGQGPGKWQVDHKEALCLFDLTDREQFLKACHFTNLQPLWHEDHVLKTVKDLEKRCTV